MSQREAGATLQCAHVLKVRHCPQRAIVTANTAATCSNTRGTDCHLAMATNTADLRIEIMNYDNSHQIL